MSFKHECEIIGNSRSSHPARWWYGMDPVSPPTYSEIDVRRDPDELRRLTNKYSYISNWQDPYAGRAMTVGEFGCALSHLQAWERAARRDVPTIILEQDAVCRQYLTEIDSLAQALDRTDVPRVVYLAQHTHGSGIPFGRLLYHEENHPLWTLAYAVTPNGASNLLRTFNTFPTVFPADELLPALMSINRSGKLNGIWLTGRLPVECLSTMRRCFDSSTGSAGSTTECGPYIPCEQNMHVLTYATDFGAYGVNRLRQSGRRYGYDVDTLGTGEKHWDASKPGGIAKLKALRKHIQQYDDADVVLFVDGYDTIFQGHSNDLYAYWAKHCAMDSKIMVAGEYTCWPDSTLKGELAELPCFLDRSPFFPNSGFIMGRKVSLVKAFANQPLDAETDDQLWLHKAMLNDPGSFLIAENDAVVCLNHHQCEMRVDDGRGQLVVEHDGSRWPYFVHANGPTTEQLDKQFRAIGGRIRRHYGDIGKKDAALEEAPVVLPTGTEWTDYRIEPKPGQASSSREIKTVSGIHMVRASTKDGWTLLGGEE